MAPQFDYGQSTVEVHLDTRAPYFVNEHFHPHYELIYVLRGVREVHLGGQTWRARSGDLLVFRPGEAHSERSGSQRIDFFVVRFYPEELASAQVNFPAAGGPVIHLPQRERFRDILERMLEERRRPGPDSRLLLGAYLVEFVVTLKRAVESVRAGGAEASSAQADGLQEASGDGQARVQAALTTIRENLDRPLDLPDLARGAFMSVRQFSHVFKEAVGESPKRYMIRERIERAKQLLAETDLPAQEIAEQLAYESPYFFYRQFKQKTGLTTAQFREQTRG